jgi:hypothetical protein
VEDDDRCFALAHLCVFRQVAFERFLELALAGRSQTAFHGEITKKTNKNSPSLLAEQVCTYIETNKEKQP